MPIGEFTGMFARGRSTTPDLPAKGHVLIDDADANARFCGAKGCCDAGGAAPDDKNIEPFS